MYKLVVIIVEFVGEDGIFNFLNEVVNLMIIMLVLVIVIIVMFFVIVVILILISVVS